MLNVTLLEFFLRGIPEAFLFVLSTHVFSKVLIDKKRYLLSSMLMAICVLGIKNLPIHFGVNTILSLITLIVLNVYLNKFEVIKAIHMGIITFIIGFMCEGLNVLLIQYILGFDMKNALQDNLLGIIYLSPSLIFLAVVVLIYYFIKRKEMRFINNGKTV